MYLYSVIPHGFAAREFRIAIGIRGTTRIIGNPRPWPPGFCFCRTLLLLLWFFGWFGKLIAFHGNTPPSRIFVIRSAILIRSISFLIWRDTRPWSTLHGDFHCCGRRYGASTITFRVAGGVAIVIANTQNRLWDRHLFLQTISTDVRANSRFTAFRHILQTFIRCSMVWLRTLDWFPRPSSFPNIGRLRLFRFLLHWWLFNIRLVFAVTQHSHHRRVSSFLQRLI